MYNQNPSPVGIGRVFSRGWDLAIRTLPNAGAILITVYLPMTVILGMLVRNMFFTIAQMISNPAAFNEHDPEVFTHLFLPMIGSYFSIWLVSILFQFLIPYAGTAAIMANWDEATDRESTVGELLRRAIRRPFWYIIVQGILISIIVSVAYGILMAIGGVIGMITHGIGFAIIPLALMVGIVYFGVATSMARHEIVAADRGPWKSLISSMSLVKGNWGKVFTVLALTMIACWVLLVPITIPMVIRIVDAIPVVDSYPQNDPRIAITMLGAISSFFSPWLMAAVGTLAAVSTHFYTSLLTSLYVELRTSHAEIETADEWRDDLTGELGMGG